MTISHFPQFSVFLAILQVIHCTFLIKTVFRFFTIFPVLQCAFFIFHIFSVSCHIPGPKVPISHFHEFQFSHHIPGPIVSISPFPRFSVFLEYSRSYSVCVSFCIFFRFLPMIQVSECAILIFKVFQCLSLYFKSYSVHLTFSNFFIFFHIPDPTVCISHVPCFSVFFAIFEVKQCAFLILNLFHCFTR